MNSAGRTEIKHHHFVAPNETMDAGNDFQTLLKTLKSVFPNIDYTIELLKKVYKSGFHPKDCNLIKSTVD
jgi:hypothetical protein